MKALGMLKTSKRFLAIVTPRNERFARLEERDLAVFERILGRENVKTEELELYNTDWSKWYKGGFQGGALALIVMQKWFIKCFMNRYSPTSSGPYKFFKGASRENYSNPRSFWLILAI